MRVFTDYSTRWVKPLSKEKWFISRNLSIMWKSFTLFNFGLGVRPQNYWIYYCVWTYFCHSYKNKAKMEEIFFLSCISYIALYLIYKKATIFSFILIYSSPQIISQFSFLNLIFLERQPSNKSAFCKGCVDTRFTTTYNFVYTVTWVFWNE